MGASSGEKSVDSSRGLPFVRAGGGALLAAAFASADIVAAFCSVGSSEPQSMAKDEYGITRSVSLPFGGRRRMPRSRRRERLRKSFRTGSANSMIAAADAAKSDGAQTCERRRLLLSPLPFFTMFDATISKPEAVTAAEQPPPPAVTNFPKVHPGLRVGDPSSGVVCEIFVDFACPYSRKLFAALLPVVRGDSSAYAHDVSFVFHNVIQPWHHQSLWLHESAYVVRMLYPECEFAYWTALFADAPRFYDREVYNLSRREFYDEISEFAAGVVAEALSGRGGDGATTADPSVTSVRNRMLQYLIPPRQDGGHYPEEARYLGSSPDDDENAIFPFTRQTVKFQRKRGVHVTPTVFFNGIEQPDISSKWTSDDWKRFLNRALLR